MYWQDLLNGNRGAVTQAHMSISALDDDGAIVYLVCLDEPMDPRLLQIIGTLIHTPERVDAYLREYGVALDGWQLAIE
jgi:hypothetical protein